MGGAADIAEAHRGKTTRALFAILCYQGYAYVILGVGAPFIGKSFGLDQSGIARMYAWISLNSIGALVLSRMADRIGRRRVLILGLFITPLGSLGALLSSSAAWFILFEILVYSAIGATFGSAIVMMAEVLSIEKRSEGQGWANLAIASGGGVCVVLAPILVHFGLSWRWMLAVAVIGMVLGPALTRRLPESRRWERAAASGVSLEGHFYDVFGSSHRRRTIPLMVATLLGEAGAVAVSTWIYYHAVMVVKLSPAQSSIILLMGGLLSTVGLVIGVRMSEMIGRVRSVLVFGLAGTIGTLAF